MSGAVCPSCGVAVVPGYVRCPKCSKPLPRRATPVVGGTALEEKRRFPVIAIVAAGFVTIAIIVYFGLRKTDEKIKRPVAESRPQELTATAEPAPAPTAPPDLPAAPAGPSATAVAGDLERTLQRQRLWSKVTIVGDRAEVRSGSCSDPAMTPALDAAVPALKAAGLTNLRCLEQSGRVVTDRDL